MIARLPSYRQPLQRYICTWPTYCMLLMQTTSLFEHAAGVLTMLLDGGLLRSGESVWRPAQTLQCLITALEHRRGSHCSCSGLEYEVSGVTLFQLNRSAYVCAEAALQLEITLHPMTHLQYPPSAQLAISWHLLKVCIAGGG